jgi:LysM repeat protein
MPVVLDHGRIVIGIPALRSDRSSAQVALVVLLGLAFALIILARLPGGDGLAGAGTGTASPAPQVSEVASAIPASDRPSARPSSSAPPGVSPGPTSSIGPQSSGRSSPAASSPATRTYKVKAGDTLIGIAAKFGTTAKAIASLNGISDISSLKIGQVLKIP